MLEMKSSGNVWGKIPAIYGLFCGIGTICGQQGWSPTMTQPAAGIEDRRVVAKRLFDALCAQYPDKYIALIQPSDAVDVPPPVPDISAAKAMVR